MIATGAQRQVLQSESVPSHRARSTVGPQLSVALMMDWTDRHCRYFLRLLAPDVRPYTEMITAHAVVHGDREYLLRFHPAEHRWPCSSAAAIRTLAEASAISAGFGYDEVNLNVGCPERPVARARSAPA